MSASSFSTIALEGDASAALARLPARAGVAQILGPEGRNLMVGRPANLRRWAANHLGRGRAAAPGKRPPTDLSPIATAVAFAEATSTLHQRLLFERLMERYVPRAKRRDLKPPGWLRLDLSERFPRILVAGAEEAQGPAFGPFRDRQAADRARTALHKVWPLRPCDYVFEPDPSLPLGLGCLYAQVRSCAAPCLGRMGEDAYRALAREVSEVLGGSRQRPEALAPVVPHFVSEAGARGLAVVSNRAGVELYPVAAGAVLEEGARSLPVVELGPETRALEGALADLRFEPTPAARDDRPWLFAWVAAQKRGGGYLVLRAEEPADALASRVREVLS